MPKVTIYSAEWCPWCQKAKQFLQEHNVEFEEKDVERNPKAVNEMIHKSGQTGIPVIDVEGNIVVGYDEEKLRKLLKIEHSDGGFKSR